MHSKAIIVIVEARQQGIFISHQVLSTLPCSLVSQAIYIYIYIYI